MRIRVGDGKLGKADDRGGWRFDGYIIMMLRGHWMVGCLDRVERANSKKKKAAHTCR